VPWPDPAPIVSSVDHPSYHFSFITRPKLCHFVTSAIKWSWLKSGMRSSDIKPGDITDVPDQSGNYVVLNITRRCGKIIGEHLEFNHNQSTSFIPLPRMGFECVDIDSELIAQNWSVELMQMHEFCLIILKYTNDNPWWYKYRINWLYKTPLKSC